LGRRICDHQGRFVLPDSNIINGRLNTLEGEAMTIKKALTELIQKSFSHVIIESDSQIVIDQVTSSMQQGSSVFSFIISNIKSLLLLVPNFEVKFVKWQTNMVVHSLARVTYSKTSCCIFNLVLPCINIFLLMI
jgi:ribonuclease HI